MSKSQMLRALVSERLAAAAEEIFVLFERTIVEYEKELHRSKEENRRNQQLLDRGVYQQRELAGGDDHIASTNAGTGPNQEIPDTPRVKEEQEEEEELIKQEEEQLQMAVPESNAAFVKTQESCPLQQRQTEETQADDVSSEPQFHSETEGHAHHSADVDNDDNWGAPFSFSAVQIKIEADADSYDPVQIRDRSNGLSTPEDAVHSGHATGAEGHRHQCPFCLKTFGSIHHLQGHIKSHSGVKPFKCSVCMKTFAKKTNLNSHTRTHTGEKPYSCTFCGRLFADSSALRKHVRIHTGEKPYSCPICKKTFARKCTLDLHKRTHTGEKPYSCPVCAKAFSQKCNLNSHISTHCR